MKQCNKCNVDLVIGENITPRAFNNADYKCKPCKNERVYNWCKKNPEAKAKITKRYYDNNTDYYKKNYRDNSDKIRASMKQNYQDNKEMYLTRQQKINTRINPGVYGVYSEDKLIYIGESQKPYRRRGEHFSIAGKQGGTKAKSVIAKALGIGELQIDNLVFKMLEFIDDTPTRKQREQALIQQHTPLYNDLYVSS